MGLHHDNPIITPLDECHYIAAIVLAQDKEIPNCTLPTFTIPAGIYAKFHLEGVYGDVLEFIRWVYHNWLVQSGYETTTSPSYTIYNKNHFLREDERFDLEFYLPIKFV